MNNTPNTRPFYCHGCGDCCTSFSIPIEREKAEQLLQRPWVQERSSAYGLTLQPLTSDLFRIPLTEQGECLFLAEDKRCLIHRHEGLSLKPMECQRFPFAGVRLPDGRIAYDVSANCKTVAEEYLETFLTIVPGEFEGIPPIQESFPKAVPWGFGKKRPWREYLTYLDKLQSTFQQESLTAAEALSTARRLLNRHPSQQLAKAPNPVLRRIFARFETFILIFFLRKPYRSLSWAELILFGRYRDPKVFGQDNLSIQSIRQVLFPETPECQRIVKGFLLNIMRRKVYLAYGYTPESLWVMAWVCLFLVRWHARVLAYLQDRTAAGPEDVSMAIRLTERYYSGHQPRFLMFFKPSSFQFQCLKRILIPIRVLNEGFHPYSKNDFF